MTSIIDNPEGLRDEDLIGSVIICFTFYLGQRIDPGEELVMDDQAYIVYHQANLGSPCLSFDVVTETDSGGEFPLQVYGVAGTQAAKANNNNIIVFKVCFLPTAHHIMSHMTPCV